jgi:hypothetical protein
MTATKQAANDQTIDAENQTTPETGQIFDAEHQSEAKSGQTKAKKNQTDNVKWSIFTEAETKVSAGKAAKKAGLKLNEWIDRTLRQTAIDELTKKIQPPAKPEDLVADIVKQFADQMEAKQAATVEQQNALIEKQGEQIAALTDAIKNQPAPPPPPSLKELIFGRSNKS